MDYDEFFIFPAQQPTTTKDCMAKCKVCGHGSKPKKYTLTSKGNLLKHLSTMHGRLLEDHRARRRQSTSSGQSTFEKDGTYQRKEPEFKNQEVILTSIAKNLCGCGGMPVTMVEKPWFREFMREVEPQFKGVSRRSVGSKISALSEETKLSLLKEISAIARHGLKPSVTVDFWTGRDNRSFMGCTVHYVYNQQLKHTMLCSRKFRHPILVKI